MSQAIDKQMQEAPMILRGRMFNRDNAKPKEQRILVLKTGLAGAQFHIQNEKERRALHSIEPGTELLLYREPENEYDQWAIRVYLTEEDQIGYVTRFKNETIARLMDAGKKFVAITDDPNELDETERVALRQQARTENMSIPFSVYLVEES